MPHAQVHALQAGRSSVPAAATITMMTMPRADVVIVILFRALDYPASAGHASWRESAGAAFAVRQSAARRLARAGPGSRGRFPEMKGHVAQDAASEPDPAAGDEAACREEFTAQASR